MRILTSLATITMTLFCYTVYALVLVVFSIAIIVARIRGSGGTTATAR